MGEQQVRWKGREIYRGATVAGWLGWNYDENNNVTGWNAFAFPATGCSVRVIDDVPYDEARAFLEDFVRRGVGA